MNYIMRLIKEYVNKNGINEVEALFDSVIKELIRYKKGLITLLFMIIVLIATGWYLAYLYKWHLTLVNVVVLSTLPLTLTITYRLYKTIHISHIFKLHRDEMQHINANKYLDEDSKESRIEDIFCKAILILAKQSNIPNTILARSIIKHENKEVRYLLV